MKILLKIVMITFGLVLTVSAFSQTKDSSYIGTVKGIAKDSANNFALQSATVAIYKVKDSTLLGYRLSGSTGEFSFTEVPVGIPLQVVVSFSGYKNFKKTFTISAEKKEINLNNLNVVRPKDMLDEVVVEYTPPVRMNGDTLEFNANAFKLDKNAVVEDLLRKLPGVTVWGDGVIYVNGKEVNNLLVDGKPFMGGDSKIAIQNLPKNAIDKVQVYQQIVDEQNPMDSTTEVNIKLKKDKKSGMFGKVEVGYGSSDKYEADGSINFYSPGTQFSLVAAANNVNKDANSVNGLMRQGTFKNNGTDVEYQPNFRVQGLSRPISGGFNYQRNFIEDERWRKRNRFTANYFIKNDDNENLRQTETLTTFPGDSSRTQNNSNISNTTSTNQTFNLNYVKENERYSLNISPSILWNQSNNNNSQQSTSSSSKQGLQSTNDIENTGQSDRKNLSLRVDYNAYNNPLKNRRIPTDDFRLSYSLNTGETNGERLNKTTFVSLINPNENKKYDRKYNDLSNTFNQSLNFSSADLKQMIFGYGNFGGIVIRFQNNLSLNAQKNSRVVADKDSVAKTYLVNQSLSNNTRLNTFNEIPSFKFSKTIRKDLANRYSKVLDFDLNTQWQFYNQQNTSDFDFQNVNRNYRKFIPDASVSYEINQYNEYKTRFNLGYRASSDYPSINQLAPLVDSSNLYNIQRGNLDLKPFDQRDFSFSIDHNSSKRKAMFGYKVGVSAGYVNNSIIDSSIIDNLGRTTHYAVNANGNKYANIDGNINKAFQFSDNQIQVNVRTNFGLSKNPNYINSVLDFSNNFSNSNGLNIYYTLQDLLSVNIGQSFNFSRSKQAGLNGREFGNSTKVTTGSAHYNFTKKLSASSNISYNSTSSTGSKNIDFTIWNANLNFRFLKGNNGEIKLAALDLLHQNVSVINSVNNNVLTTGVANVLQNYYMVSFSYYPRKFGGGGSSRRNR